MLNFTVGPVQMDDQIREIGQEQIPYFRTSEFSEVMLENENMIKRLTNATDDARAVFLTGSGTAAMEATIMNVFTKKDKVLVVNGGSFGRRFVELCVIHEIPYTEIKLEYGEVLTKKHLSYYDDKGYTGFLVNIHETSTGVLYDLDIISEFCKKNELVLVVDAISSFIADEIHMKENEIDVIIIGSQKALACPPGVAILVLSKKALDRVNENHVKSMYFDLKSALRNGERGQTPFTPAVGILRQIHARLRQIDSEGIEREREKIATIANDFRTRIKGLPLEIASTSMSNAVTPVRPLHGSAYRIFEILKDQYGIWVCPNGGELAEQIFRVGHIGNLTIEDNSKLIQAMTEIFEEELV